jgi:virulence factor Mce-like protein
MGGRGRRSRGPRTVIVGAAVLLIAVVAVVISVQATSRLPFVPVYTLHLRAPNAAQVTKNDDVTIAGTRVGQVRAVTAVRGPAGPEADLELAIDKRYSPVPVDSTYAIRLTGTLGAKAVEITPGHSPVMMADGSVLPERQAVPRPVDLDQLFGAFDTRARDGARSSLLGFATGVAGRGADLNTAISRLVPLTGDLVPVMRGLAAPSTALGPFVRSLNGFFGALRPVAQTQATLVSNLDRTFGALAPVAPALAQTIARSPATLADGTTALDQTRPLLRATTALLADLRPAANALPGAAPPLADALSAGAGNFPKVPALSEQTAGGLQSLQRFATSAPARPGVERLALTFGALQPLLAFLTPAQTTCNYPALLIRNVASLFEDHVSTGTTARVGGVVVGVATNSERGPSTTYFTGKPAHALGPLHWSPYPYTAAPAQPDSCEAGHEPYIRSRAVIGNVPVKTPGRTESATASP